jgi:hypothetical protein
MIEIRLYGKLRQQSSINEIRETGILHLTPESGETLNSLLGRIRINTEDAHSIFLNAKLLAARSNMARWLRYQETTNNPLDWNLDVPLNSGDRVGIFGRDMAALVV